MKGALEGRHDYWIRISESEKGIFVLTGFCFFFFLILFCSPIPVKKIFSLPISSISDPVLDLVRLSRGRLYVGINCLAPFWMFFQCAF